MPEDAHQIHRRAAHALRTPSVEEWETFPFQGPVTPRPLEPPMPEPTRAGAGGLGCRACAASDSDYLWVDDVWRLQALEPNGLPVVVLLEPRAHHTERGDLPDDVARDLGLMLCRVERAVRSVQHIERVHVCRWGDGAEHLHWWFMASPTGLPQLMGSFAAIWDDILPPTPQGIWDANVAQVRRAMG